MERIDHNGEGFRYIVGYKRHDIPDAQVIEETVYNWEQEQLVIYGQPTFREYEVYVKASNNLGDAPESRLKPMIGYSGEGSELSCFFIL